VPSFLVPLHTLAFSTSMSSCSLQVQSETSACKTSSAERYAFMSWSCVCPTRWVQNECIITASCACRSQSQGLCKSSRIQRACVSCIRPHEQWSPMNSAYLCMPLIVLVSSLHLDLPELMAEHSQALINLRSMVCAGTSGVTEC